MGPWRACGALLGLGRCFSLLTLVCSSLALLLPQMALANSLKTNEELSKTIIDLPKSLKTKDFPNACLLHAYKKGLLNRG